MTWDSRAQTFQLTRISRMSPRIL